MALGEGAVARSQVFGIRACGFKEPPHHMIQQLMQKLLPLANRFSRCCSFATQSSSAFNRPVVPNTPLQKRYRQRMAGASPTPSGGPNRFGLDKTKGLNDLCRRDARIRAEKEAAAQEEFSRRLGECSLEEHSSLAAQRHFALQVLLPRLCVFASPNIV